MRCERCGARLAADTLACPHCGSAQTRAPSGGSNRLLSGIPIASYAASPSGPPVAEWSYDLPQVYRAEPFEDVTPVRRTAAYRPVVLPPPIPRAVRRRGRIILSIMLIAALMILLVGLVVTRLI